jgi:hypothetical protein
MHDGFYDTLADVVWHYDQGGAPERDPHRGSCDQASGDSCPEIAPLGLSDRDREDLVAFLGSLTGQARPYVLTRRPPGGLPGLPADFAVSCPTSAGTNP